MFRLLFFILFIFPLVVSAQSENKHLKTNFVAKAPKIDAVLDDSAWESVPIATDFVMFEPGTGISMQKKYKTQVKVVYDHTAIYIAALMKDPEPSKIPMQFSTRDNFGQSDYFAVAINPFNDGVNDFVFFVASTGAQSDMKRTIDGEDSSWNAVWESAAKLTDDAWVVEMKIPYSALRFSNEPIQTWGVNFYRFFQNTREQFSWVHIDKTKGRITEYCGELTGIKNINPPVRLSLYPYSQVGYSYFDGTGKFNASAGMDVKYGINDSFTLDATLIPDFGQVAFDDLVLNLGPFEQQYEEKRPFFTEGTELFAKGDLFYSRRIGGTPINYYSAYSALNENEVVTDNPDKSKMINAVKVSGRTKNGFALGFFNAITSNTKAVIQNEATDEEREVITDPFTNYNVLVLEQQFRKNSSVSLINTSVLRNGKAYDANVTSLILDIRSKNNKYALETDLSLSNKFYQDNTVSGLKGNFDYGKVSGAHQYGVAIDFSDKNYDKRDMGYQQYQNYIIYESSYSYRIFEPTKTLNNFRISAMQRIYYFLDPYSYIGNGTNIRMFATTRKYLSFGTFLNLSFGNQYDHYEPRVEGRFYKFKPPQSLQAYISTDYRKKFALDFSLSAKRAFGVEQPEEEIGFSISPRFRFSNQFQMNYSLRWNKRNNRIGYVDLVDDSILFGKRNSMSVVNSLSGVLNLSTKSAFSLSFRYYWSPVTYEEQLYELQNDGSLIENSYTDDYNKNFNSWNIDFSYSLEFAPGSQLVALYRNTIFDQNNQSDLSYIENINSLFEVSSSHQLSLKLIYYLDFNSLKI